MPRSWLACDVNVTLWPFAGLVLLAERETVHGFGMLVPNWVEQLSPISAPLELSRHASLSEKVPFAFCTCACGHGLLIASDISCDRLSTMLSAYGSPFG